MLFFCAFSEPFAILTFVKKDAYRTKGINTHTKEHHHEDRNRKHY